MKSQRKQISILNEQSCSSILKIRKLRRKLKGIKEENIYCESIHKKFQKKARLVEMLSLLKRLKVKFGKIHLELSKPIKVMHVGEFYKILLISGLYCIKKFNGGYYFFFIKDLFSKIQSKLTLLKHKLKSNLYYILKLN